MHVLPWIRSRKALTNQRSATRQALTNYKHFSQQALTVPLTETWASDLTYVYRPSLGGTSNSARKIFSGVKASHYGKTLGALRDSFSRAPLLLVTASIYIVNRHIGPVRSLSGHAIAYRWRLSPRVRRPKAISPQGRSSNRCCLFCF